MIPFSELDALAARRHALWTADFGLPTGYQRYIEYHAARALFTNTLALHWPEIRAMLAPNDQHLMMNDSERIPHVDDRTEHTRTCEAAPKARQQAKEDCQGERS